MINTRKFNTNNNLSLFWVLVFFTLAMLIIPGTAAGQNLNNGEREGSMGPWFPDDEDNVITKTIPSNEYPDGNLPETGTNLAVGISQILVGIALVWIGILCWRYQKPKSKKVETLKEFRASLHSYSGGTAIHSNPARISP